MCKGGSPQKQTTQTNSTTEANPQAMALYNNLLQRAQGVSDTPYTPYGGELVAPNNAQQNLGISGINSYAPAFQQATGVAGNAAGPITQQQVQSWVDPWTQNVVNATQNQFNNQNQQQQQQLKGNEIAQGALGNSRNGVAQGILANQQQLAQAPVIAGLNSQGYTQGVNTALAAQRGSQAGAANLAGVAGQGVSGAGAQVGAGSLQQQTQQAQDAARYQQFLMQQAYPFQTTQWLAGIGTGVGSQMGSTTSGTSNTQGYAAQPGMGQQLLGGLSAGAGLLGQMGAFSFHASGGRVSDDDGVANRPMTVPESFETLLAQQEQLRNGHRRVQMFPKGTPELQLPHGMERAELSHGTFHYDPQRISAEEIHHHAGRGRENELLDLGPYSKDDVLERWRGGETPIALVERNPHGHEVRAAAGTHSTLPQQWGVMRRAMTPGHSLHLEHPAYTLHRRCSGGGVSGYAAGGAPDDQPSGVAGIPYAGGRGWVPGANLVPRPLTPSTVNAPSMSMAGAGSQNPLADQMKSITGIAKNIQQGLGVGNSGDEIGNLGGYTPGPRDNYDQVYSGNTMDFGGPRAFGGGVEPVLGVRGYAEGGMPGDYSDSGAVPALPDSPVQGFGDEPRLAPDDPRLKVAEAPALAPTEGVVPLPRARPPVATGEGEIPAGVAASPATPTAGYADNMDKIAAAHRRIESGSHAGNYGAIGKPHPKTGDRAYGAYQVMGANVGPWTEEVLGRRMTPVEFLGNKEAQDAVYKAKMGGYINKYGLDGALKAWLGPGSQDFTGTTQSEYRNRFKAAFGAGGDEPDQSSGIQLASYKPPGDTQAAYKPSSGVAPASTDAAAGVAPAASKSGVNWGADSRLWPALAAAGFGMMSSRAPSFGQAIGEGGLTGLQTYTSMTQQDRQNTLAAQRLSQQLDYQNKNLAQQKDFHYNPVATPLSDFQKQQLQLQKEDRERNWAKEARESSKPVVLKTSNGEFSATPLPFGGGYRIMDPGGKYDGVVVGGRGAAKGTPGEQQPQENRGFQNAAYDPDKVGTVRAVSNMVASGSTHDYSDGAPTIEKGMDLPEPAQVANKSTRTLQTDAENYLQTGKLPAVRGGKSPVAIQQQKYQDAVKNYGGALAESRGLTPSQTVDIQRSSSGMLRFILGADGRSTVALGTAVRHLDTLAEYAKAWAANDTQAINRIRTVVSRQFGSDAATNLEAVARIVGPEIIKAIGVAGAGTHDERANVEKAFSTASSAPQVMGAILATQKLLGGQLTGRKQQAALAGVSEEKFRSLVGERPYQILSDLEKEGHGKPAAAPAAAGAALPPGVPPGSISGMKGGKPVWRTPDGQFIPKAQ